MDMTNGQLRANVFSKDMTPVNPHAQELYRQKY
jgi:hypothetical protein